jgi:hypothetical protein
MDLGRAGGQAPQPRSGAPKAQGLTARTKPKPAYFHPDATQSDAVRQIKVQDSTQAHVTSLGRLFRPTSTSYYLSIGVNKRNELFGQVREKLQFSGIQRLVQKLE